MWRPFPASPQLYAKTCAWYPTCRVRGTENIPSNGHPVPVITTFQDPNSTSPTDSATPSSKKILCQIVFPDSQFGKYCHCNYNLVMWWLNSACVGCPGCQINIHTTCSLIDSLNYSICLLNKDFVANQLYAGTLLRTRYTGGKEHISRTTWSPGLGWRKGVSSPKYVTCRWPTEGVPGSGGGPINYYVSSTVTDFVIRNRVFL